MLQINSFFMFSSSRLVDFTRLPSPTPENKDLSPQRMMLYAELLGKAGGTDGLARAEQIISEQLKRDLADDVRVSALVALAALWAWWLPLHRKGLISPDKA